MKRTPLPRTRLKPRRTTSPRCTMRGCKKPQRVSTWCVTHGEREADRQFSLFIRARDGRCTAAGVLEGGCKGNLQAAHVIGRTNKTVRFDERNVHSLCQAHHMTVDQHGQEHAKWIWATSILGAREFAKLNRDARPTTDRALASVMALARYGDAA